MIDKVAICGLRRANSIVPMQEIQQAIGRAGRSYTKSGEAVIICEPCDNDYAVQCFEESAPPVKSTMSSVDDVGFHILPWIARIYDDETFSRWFSRTLAFQQGMTVKWDDVKNHLVEMGSIDAECNLTELGRISSRFYFKPRRIKSLCEKLSEAYCNGNVLEPPAMSWVLSSEHIQMDDVEAIELSDYKQLCNTAGYRFHNGELIQGYGYFCILVNQRSKWMKPVVIQLREDISRLLGALSYVACHLQLPIVDDIRSLITSITQRVPFDVAKLMDDLHLSKKQYAYELNDLDVTCKEDIQFKLKYIEKYGSDELKNELVSNGVVDDIAILSGIGHFK